jgi:uncharacterized protein
MTNLWVIFLTGLTVGGLTCLAVQGGLLASVIAAREEKEIEQRKNIKNSLWPVGAFILAKLLSYSLLGLLLGAFGGALNITTETQIWMQGIAGVYMIAVALNLLNIHPFFRYVIFQPPRFLTRLVRNQSKSKELFAPALLGAMTIFIPCGTTIAMEALAISSGSAFSGMLIMFIFILGTVPLFFGLGSITSLLGDKFRARFLRLAAILVLYLGVTSVNGALVAGGSPITLQKIYENSPIQLSLGGSQSPQAGGESTAENGVQNATITISSKGYSPTYLKVKQGVPLKLSLESKDAYNCASAFRIPALKIAKNVRPNTTEIVEFTPTEKGKMAFTCSMGMYTGVIEVI